MPSFALFLFSAILMLAGVARADQIILANGDQLSGQIVEFDGKELRMKTDLAGEVKVKWEHVEIVHATEKLTMELADGRRLVGRITTRNGRFTVMTEDVGTVEAERKQVTGIRSAERQAAYEKEVERLRDPRIIDLWKGFYDLGFAQTRGNADTNTFTNAAEAVRETPRDRIAVRFRSIRSRSDVRGEAETTANAIRGGITYNLNVSPNAYVFGSTDLEFDEFQALDLRFVPGGGFGWKVWRRGRSFFDIQGGASLNREFFSTGVTRTSGEALVGEELSYELTDRIRLLEKIVVYPNLTSRGDFRVVFDATISTRLNRWFSWQITLGDRYISNPAPGRQRNDVLLTTGVRLTLEP
jgi:putative salt-induced outer membrane protein